MVTKIKHNRSTPNVKAACEECRSRKTRCDGVRPACSRCIQKSKHCEYDAEPDEHRMDTLRRKCKRWEQQALAGEQLLLALRDQPEGDAVNLLRRLRTNENVETIIASLPRSEDHENETRDRSPSAAGSYSSGDSAAFSSGSAPEVWLQSTQNQTRQQVQPAPRAVPIDLQHRSREVNKLAIDFLVNSGNDPGQAQAGPQRSAAGSSSYMPRLYSYPPDKTSDLQSHRRASAPVAINGINPQNSGAEEAGDEASNSANGQVAAPGHNIGAESKQASDWDHYYRTVSSLMKRMREGAAAHPQ